MASRYQMQDLLQLMARLRDPQHGCPWDLEQTFSSIVPHTLEECYELADTIERGDTSALRDELGDLLFQVVFYVQLAREQQLFEFEDVIDNLVNKLLRRHPHVFPGGTLAGGETGPKVDSEGVHRQWEAIKAEERADKKMRSALDDIPLNLPALSRAAKLQRRAARVGFDWDEPDPVVAKIHEELEELRVARQQADAEEIAAEMGDVLFACVNLARHLGVDPEAALRATGRKFERRFRYVEQRLKARGETTEAADLATMDEFWDEAKREGL